MMSTSLNDMIVVYNASGKLDGEIIKAFLEANDIRVIMTQEGAATAYGLTVGAFGKVEILVDRENLERARELLTSMEEGKLESDIADPSVNDKEDSDQEYLDDM
jgi:hypothetical protein